MRERPILFSGPMVRAIFADQKRQTRRIIQPQPRWDATVAAWRWNQKTLDDFKRYRPGDRLWVREAWRVTSRLDDLAPREISLANVVQYEADPAHRLGGLAGRLRPGMFMPRWASRLSLDVTGERLGRAQAISDADIAAEGVTVEAVRALWEGATRKRRREACLCVDEPLIDLTADGAGVPYESFEDASPHDLWAIAWTLINGRASWDANPWVWVVEFEPTSQRG